MTSKHRLNGARVFLCWMAIVEFVVFWVVSVTNMRGISRREMRGFREGDEGA